VLYRAIIAGLFVAEMLWVSPSFAAEKSARPNCAIKNAAWQPNEGGWVTIDGQTSAVTLAAHVKSRAPKEERKADALKSNFTGFRVEARLVHGPANPTVEVSIYCGTSRNGGEVWSDWKRVH